MKVESSIKAIKDETVRVDSSTLADMEGQRAESAAEITRKIHRHQPWLAAVHDKNEFTRMNN